MTARRWMADALDDEYVSESREADMESGAYDDNGDVLVDIRCGNCDAIAWLFLGTTVRCRNCGHTEEA